LRPIDDALLAAERRAVLPELAEVVEEPKSFFSATATAAASADATAVGCDPR
jgi:hypothetical protein